MAQSNPAFAETTSVNRLRHDKPARRVIKQARWLLLRNPENLHQPEQQIQLHELLSAN